VLALRDVPADQLPGRLGLPRPDRRQDPGMLVVGRGDPLALREIEPPDDPDPVGDLAMRLDYLVVA